MAKMKTHRASAKRFKRTGTGRGNPGFYSAGWLLQQC